MGRAFTGTQRLDLPVALLTAPPLTFSCWFKAGTASGLQAIVSISDTGGSFDGYTLYTDGNKISMLSFALGGESRATTTTSFVTGKWYHACGVVINNASRAAYLNGGGKGTNTGNRPPTGLDSTRVRLASGSLAAVVIRKVALSDAEVALEASCTSWDEILSLRPDGIIGAWRLWGVDELELDESGFGNHLPNLGSTNAHDDPPQIVYPRRLWFLPLLFAGGSTIPAKQAYYRRRRAA
jgi:hypothetical protein